MRAVFVCQQNPWKLDGGALIRNYWMVRALAQRYPLDLVTADDDAQSVPADFATSCASVARFPRPRGYASRRNRVLGMLRPHGSFFTSGSVSVALRKEVRHLTASRDVFVMIDLQMRDALPAGVPFVYNAHNAEYELLRRRAAIESSMFARAFVRLDAERIKPLEREFLSAACMIAACSLDDRRDFLRLAPAADEKILVVPNGVDLERYAQVARLAGEVRTIAVTGSYDWRPNRVGLMWFTRDVLPALCSLRAAGDFAIRIVGRMDTELARSLDALPYVTAVPNPADMRCELTRATIVAAPILASSGTRLRILESWAAGRPVVTTTPGALGLVCRNGHDIAIADGAQAFARALSRLLDDESARAAMRVAALQSVAAYAWPRIVERFLRESEPFIAPCASRARSG